MQEGRTEERKEGRSKRSNGMKERRSKRGRAETKRIKEIKGGKKVEKRKGGKRRGQFLDEGGKEGREE